MKGWMFAVFFGICLLPFLHRPWLFDDPSVVITARAAAAHPLHPYTYALDLDRPDQLNWPPGGHPAYTHPPLSAWILGLIDHWSGGREWPLHIIFFATAGAILIAFHRMSPVFTTSSMTVLFWLGFSPVFFLTSLVLYPHFFYLLFYELSLICAWKAARETSSWRWGAGLGVALSLAALTLDQWPVLIFLIGGWFWISSKERRAALNPLGLALGFFAVIYGMWCAWEIHLYGQTHLTAVFHVRAGGSHYPWKVAGLPLIFLAGGLPMTVIAWPALWRFSKGSTVILIGLAVAMAMILSSSIGGFLWPQSSMMAFFFATGLAFLLALLTLIRDGSETDRMLLMWFLTEFVFVQVFLTYPAGHHLLEVALPTVLLCARLAERLSFSNRLLVPATLAMGLLTLSLARADRSLADIGPRLAQEVAPMSKHLYYWGNSYSGYSYYLNRVGAQPYDFQNRLGPDDYLLVPHNFNVQGMLKWPKGQRMVYVATRAYRIPDVWRTFSIGDSAGWYSASWGALPYSFSRQPAEWFTLLRGAPLEPLDLTLSTKALPLPATDFRSTLSAPHKPSP